MTAEYLGNVVIPEILPSGTFSIVSDYGYGRAHAPDVVIHQFGAANAKLEQRFLLGTGAKRFTVHRSNMRESDRVALRDFWENNYGPYGAFTYYPPNDDGTTGTTPFICRFANEPLSWEFLSDAVSSIGVNLIEIPTTSPTYTLNSTCTRFPSSALKTALLSQVQEIIPLIKIQPRTAGYPAIYVSDRRCTVGAQLYLARLLEPPDGVSQSIGNESDQAQFLFGNADRVMTELSKDTDLKRASIEFSLFHVGSGIKLDLWKGEIADWKLDAGPVFSVTAVDGMYELTLPYPTRKISRTCWKCFNDGLGCPNAAHGAMDYTHFPAADPTKCDKSYDSANGCLAHGMKMYFGGILAEPQGVRIKDNSTGTLGFGRSSITSVSIVADSIYDQVVPEIYTSQETYKDANGQLHQGRLVNCKVAAGRSEIDFYDALGIVGEGPLGLASVGHTLDNQYNHGYPGLSGLRSVSGYDPATSTYDTFSLGQSGGAGGDWRKNDTGGKDNFSAGLAFLEIRRKDSGSLQLSYPSDHAMQAIVLYGLPGWVWSSAGNRTSQTLTNPIWIAINMMLRARGLYFADATVAEQYFIVDDAIAAAAICDERVGVLVGLASGTCSIWTDSGETEEIRVTIDGVTNYPVGQSLTIEGYDYYIQSSASGYGVLSSSPGDGTYAFTIKETQFRWTGVMQEEKPLRDWIQEVLMNCLGYYSFAFGKLKLGIRENSSVVEAFTEGNILFGSLQLSPLKPAFNHLTANFADGEFNFAANSISVYDEDYAKFIGGATAPLFLKSNMNLSGTSTKSQAARNISTRNREELGGINAAQWKAARQLAFRTTILALNTEPGQVDSMTHADMPAGVGEFRVGAWKLNKDYSIDIQGQTTVDEMYDLTAGPKPADVTADPVPVEPVQGPDTDVPSVPQNVTIYNDDELSQLAGNQLRVDWDEPETNALGIGGYFLEINDSATFPSRTLLVAGTTGQATAGAKILTDPNVTFLSEWIGRTVWIYRSVADGQHVVSTGVIRSVTEHSCTLDSPIRVTGIRLAYEVIVPTWEQVIRAVSILTGQPTMPSQGSGSGWSGPGPFRHFSRSPAGGLTSGTYYFRLSAFNGWGIGPWSTVVAGTLWGIKQEDLKKHLSDIVINASKFLSVIAGTFTNNSPGANYVAWSGIEVNYGEVTYTITGGNTADVFIYWQLASPNVFQHSAVLPALGNDGFLIGLNGAGTFVSCFNSTTVHSSIISGQIVRTQITDLAVDTPQLNANAVVAGKIYFSQLSGIAADLGTITAGTITGATIRTSASNPRTEMNATDGLISVDSTPVTRLKIKDGILYIYDTAGNLSFSVGGSGIAICDSVGTLAAYHNLTLSAPLGYVDINALGLRVNGVGVTVP
jgi:hypothetical protein